MLSLGPLVTLLAYHLARVHAGVYVTNPTQPSACTGGQSCTVEWIDDGQAPLLASIGQCSVGLYTGEYTLAQSLQSVDVSSTSSFSFTVDPSAGPNGQYYIVFSNSNGYQSFSASFGLSGMTGTLPGGGSSTSAPTTSAGSSTSAGSTSATSPTDTATGSTVSTPSGTSDTGTGTITPTGSTSAVDTTATTGITSPTVASSSSTVTASSGTPTSSSATTVTRTSTSTSTSASASGTNAAGRVGSSTSLGGVAALLVFLGVLTF